MVEMKLCLHAYYIISTCFHDDNMFVNNIYPRELSFESWYASVYIFSMTTTNCKASGNLLYNNFFTSQASTHGDETWYASVLHRFYDDDMFEQQK